MMEAVESAPDSLEVLFELFNEDLQELAGSGGEEDSLSVEDTGDDTSSESSGSSGLSSQSGSRFPQLSSYYPSPPEVSFAPNPLSSFTSEVTGTSNKRTKTEEKLIRNRESANKSRLKRKNEKFQLEETVATLREQVRTLEMENNALLTDNTTLSQHNFFLQELLKKQKLENDSSCNAMTPASKSHMPALGGISMLCVVFSVSLFKDWFPSLQDVGMGSESNGWDVSSGRVLLSVDDDDYRAGVSLSDPSDSTKVALHYVLILSSMFLYYFFIQYDNVVQKKSTCILPS
jgi:hypothetical protein